MADYGYAPYQEARLSALQRALMGAAAGLGAAAYAPPGQGFLGGLGFGAQAGLRQAMTAQDAAMKYAAMQEEARRRNEELEIRQSVLDKPPKEPPPEKPEKDPREWYFRPEFFDAPGAAELRTKATHIPQRATPGAKTGAAPKPPKPPAPMSIPRRIPAQATEQSIIDSIMQETDPAVLSPYVSGRGGADSKAIREAAQARSNEIMRQRH